MSHKDESPGENWRWAGGTFMVVGLWLTVRYFLKGNTFAIFGLLTAICGVGLWFQQQWARWGAIAMCVTVALFYLTMRLLDHTFGLETLVLVLGSSYGAWHLWKDYRKPTALEEAKDKKPLISLVLLLRQPRYLEARVLAESVSTAWGERYSSGDDGKKDSVRWVVGETPRFMTNAPEGIFMINNFDHQYFDNMQGVLEYVQELRLRKAVEEHQAWLSVDLISLHDKNAAPESAYPRIARLIAELAGPDCVGLFQPGPGRISVWDEALENKLRGPDCLEAFGVEANVPVIGVEDDDPRMKAAVEQARARWPEFVEAFQKRDGENFSIKAPITADNRREFIWVEVNGLEPEYIHGTLANNPVDLGNLKMGDRVEVPLKDLNDWAFLRNGEAVGMFTVKVVMDIQKRGE
jgi:uncharacterized protein YegJ (DUF2314 family)